MFTKFLLPPAAARIGWWLSIPSLVLMFAVIHYDFHFEFLEFSRAGADQKFFDEDFLWTLKSNNFTDEIGTILLLSGLILISFARQPDEDERIAQIRLESLLWAVLINTLLIILCTILFYQILFLQVMAYNIATTLLLFVTRFHGILYFERRKSVSHDE
jgi:hypothetical protein